MRGSCTRFYCNMGHWERQSGKVEAALESYGRSIDTLVKALQKEPTNNWAQESLRNAYWGRAYAWGDLGHYTEALKDSDKALEIQEQLTHLQPNKLDYVASLGGGYCDIGKLEFDAGKPETALTWYDRSIGTLERVLEHGPSEVKAEAFLYNAHWG